MKPDKQKLFNAYRTPREHQLLVTAMEFEEKYFADMRLDTPTIRRSLLRYKIQSDDGKWHDTESDPPPISVGGWIFRYRRFRGNWLGSCDWKHEVISIRPGLGDVEHRAALLHEMLHAYEHQLSLYGSYQEWLLIHLNDRLAKGIGPTKLRQYINTSMHRLLAEHSHGVLFLLKSLDLDRRLRWESGTVFGYDRQEYFNETTADQADPGTGIS